MKRYSLFVVIILFSILNIKAQESKNIFTIKDDKIITNSDFIDSSYDKTVINNKYILNEKGSNVLVGEVEYDVKVGSYIYCSVNFDVLEISKNGVQQCLYREDSGILKRDYKCLYYSMKKGDSDFVSSETNNYYMEFSLSPKIKGLLFFCNRYGTSVGKTLIFILTQKEAKLVFNKKMEVMDFYHSNSKLKLLLWSAYMEFNLDGTLWRRPDVHTIWREDGILKLKKNA